MPGKTLPFRLYAQILIFSGLIALGGLILWPLQQAIYGGMIGIRDDLIDRLERQIDRKIRYTSISPSLLGSFDVRNVSIMGEDVRPVLTISRFRIAYSLLDLLRGRTQAIRSVRIDSPLIDFNTARDSDLLKLFEQTGDGRINSPESVAAMLPEKLLVRIRNGKCQIINSRGHFELDSLNLSADIAANRIVLNGRWNIGVAAGNPAGKPVSLRIAMSANGSCDADMKEGEAVISIPSVTGDAQSKGPVSLGFALNEETIRLWKVPDKLPFDFSVDYRLDDEDLIARFTCNDFMLGEFLALRGGLENASLLLNIESSGAASLERHRDGKLGYSVELSGEAAELSSASFEIKAAGDEELAQIDIFRLSLPVSGEAAGEETKAFFSGNVSFTGAAALKPFSPHGVLYLDNFSLTGVNGLNAELELSTLNRGNAREINAFCDTLFLGQGDNAVELTAFNALLQPSDRDMGFIVSALRFTGMESYYDVRMGSFSLEGSVNSESRRIEASLLLDSFSAADIVGIAVPFVRNFNVPGIFRGGVGGTLITTEVFLTTDTDHLLYNAPRIVIANSAGKGFMGLISVSGTGKRFQVSDGRLIWGDEAFYMSGEADFADPAKFGFSMNANYHEYGYFVEGTVLSGKSVNIKGSYGLNVNLNSAGGAYSGAMSAEAFPLPFLGRPALLSMSAVIGYDTASSWSVNLEKLTASGITSPAGPAQISISGRADQNGAVFPAIYYRDSLGPLNGRSEISWAEKFTGFDGVFVMAEGAENYRMEGAYNSGHLNVALSGSSMRLNRVFAKIKNVSADGNVRLSWDSINSFNAVLNISSVSGRISDKEFRASVSAAMNEEEITLNNLYVNFTGLEGSVPGLTINGSKGAAETRLELKGFAGGKRLEGKMAAAAQFEPIRSWREIGKAVNSFSGNISVEGLDYGRTGKPQNFDVAFSRNTPQGSGFSVNGGPRNMLRLQVDREGNFFAGLSSPFPVRGSVTGSVREKMINARCNNLYVDVAGLFTLLPAMPDFYLSGGYVNISADIKGSITDPEFFGTARGTSLRIHLPNYIPQEIRPIPFNVAIEGNDMRFGPVSVAVGSGAGTVNGWFRFDRWIPNIFSLDIAVPRETAIPFNFDITGFSATGDAAGRLNVSLEDLIYDISGDLYANNTEMGFSSEEMAAAQNKAPYARQRLPVVTHLTISTGPVVEFLYPNKRFPILRANPDIGTKIAVSSDTQTQQYSLVSDVRIRSGEIFYFERSFYIRSGLLTFRENELRFSPRLTARAEVRDRNDDGPVTISMIVDNAPLLSFTARFESNPPLSQMEILALLGQSFVGQGLAGAPIDENGQINRAFLSSTSDLLAQFIVVRQLEQQIRNFMRLDMFSVRTQALQNAVFMATGLIQLPVDRSAGVGNYFDNTTVFGGKYIGQDMFVQGMLSMRYDANKTSLGGLTFAPDFGVELQSPLFSIRWDFVPAHPENWYVNDNSITLSWSRSF